MNRASSRRRRIGTAALLCATAACTAETETPVEPVVELAATLNHDGGWDLPLDGAGQLARAFSHSPCTGGHHRDFDFWVGEWNVTNVNGTHIGTNIVTSELDGCLVFEHWTSATGTRGLSLNDYDPETGLWNQAWVSQVPVSVTGALRPTGGLVNGQMVLEGTRDATGGFTFRDRWTWHENAQGQVIQNAITSVPELNFESTFTGIYTRGTVVPAAPATTNFCLPDQAGGQTRLADFLVGSWSVSGEHGPLLGSATIESELADCLFVERFHSRGGLEAVSFTYFDVWTERWYRIQVDSEGERIQLEGSFENGALVLTGTEDTRSGPVEVSITWRPHGSGFVQVWRTSRNGGTSWKHAATLLYGPG
jgi:hypothetical protein